MQIATIADVEREIAALGSVHALVLHMTTHGPWDSVPGSVLAHVLARLAKETAEALAEIKRRQGASL